MITDNYNTQQKLEVIGISKIPLLRYYWSKFIQLVYVPPYATHL